MPWELWALSPDKMEIREYGVPELLENQVLTRCEYGAAKHGTESSMVKGFSAGRGRRDTELGLFIPHDSEPAPGPTRVGNMYVGTVVRIGPGVTSLSEGDRILSYGTFREVHVAHEDRCWKMPDDLSWRSAVCLDPAEFAMAAVRDGQVRIGDAVAVFGMGAIGLMVVQFVKLSGAEPVIAIDPLPNRRRVAELCGADLIFDPTACDAGLEIRKATGKEGVDVAVDYSGNVHALQAALRSVAFGGNVVAGAAPSPYGEGLDLGSEAHWHIPNIIFSRACSEPNREHPRWNEERIYTTCWRLICEGKITGEHIVDPVVSFEDLVTEYPKIMSDPGSNVKLGASFG